MSKKPDDNPSRPRKYKTKTGRPTAYKPEFCDMLVEHMANGYSFESFAAVVNTCRTTLYNWEKDHPDFLYAKNCGRDKMSLFYEDMGINAMLGKIKNFQQAVYIFTIKNKLNWSEKSKEEMDNDSKSFVLAYGFNKNADT